MQVRLWKVERSHDDILRYMRRTGGSLDNHADLIAYWKFDEPDGWATCNLPSLGLPLLHLQCFFLDQLMSCKLPMGSSERNWSVVCRADGLTSAHLVAKDSSGNGNDLPLVSPPMHLDADISKAGY